MFDTGESATGFVTEKTLRASVVIAGIGLHTGKTVTMTIHPAASGTGVTFRRNDLLSSYCVEQQSERLSEVSVRVSPQAVTRTALGTTITNEFGISVNTVEHLMSAFAGLGIDNALVELDGPEVPIMDGSAEPFITALDKAGLRELGGRRLALRITKKVAVKDGDRWLYLTPNSDDGDQSCHIDVLVDYEDPSIGRQRAEFEFTQESFRNEVAAARTFCNMKDVETMRERGLALGGSLDNAIVVEDGKVLNEGGLRFDGEFVWHKVLDLIGDLYLLGRPIMGRVTAFKPGHDLNTRLSRLLAESPDCFELVELRDEQATALRANALGPAALSALKPYNPVQKEGFNGPLVV